MKVADSECEGVLKTLANSTAYISISLEDKETHVPSLWEMNGLPNGVLEGSRHGVFVATYEWLRSL